MCPSLAYQRSRFEVSGPPLTAANQTNTNAAMCTINYYGSQTAKQLEDVCEGSADGRVATSGGTCSCGSDARDHAQAASHSRPTVT